MSKVHLIDCMEYKNVWCKTYSRWLFNRAWANRKRKCWFDIDRFAVWHMKNKVRWDKTKTDGYGQYDTASKIYEIANRILRKNGKMILFSQEPYTTELINEAIPNVPFSYRAIWEKDNFANALRTKTWLDSTRIYLYSARYTPNMTLQVLLRGYFKQMKRVYKSHNKRN